MRLYTSVVTLAAAALHQATPWSRRSLLASAITQAATAPVADASTSGGGLSVQAAAGLTTTSGAGLSVQAAADIVKAHCDRQWLDGVQDGGSLLYRGVPGLRGPAVVSEAPDLLDASTYGSSDAAADFARLEVALGGSSLVRPSIGHIGVASAEAATAWGSVASVWPLGSVHYAWRRRGEATTLWPHEGSVLGDLVVDRALNEALASGSEVLFACRGNRYVAVPLALDERFRSALGLDSRPSSQR